MSNAPSYPPVQRSITWFDKTSEELLGDEALPELELSLLQQLFEIPTTNPMFDTYRLGPIQAAALQPHLKHRIELEQYDYFLDASAID